jgi:signal transduction histidine kinase
MKIGAWQWLKRLPATLSAGRPEPSEHAARIVTLQRNIILPARLVTVAFVLYYLHNSPWLTRAVNEYGVVFETTENIFAGYALLALATTVLFYVPRRFPSGAVQWLVFIIGLGDAVFLGGLTVLTGGFESPLYWVYPGVIVLNAVSIPLAIPQIVLNLALSVFFLVAGLIESGAQAELSLPGFSLHRPPPKISAENLQDLPALVAWLRQSPKPMPESLWERLPESARAKLSASLWDQLSEPTRAKLSAYLQKGAGEVEVKTALVDDLNRIVSPPRRYMVDAEPPEVTAASYVLRVAVLVLFTFCCYGLQVLVAAQQRAEEEQKEFLVRTEQLRGAGRLAAEFAHQIKNPLAIINNAVFSLQRGLKNGRPETVQPLQIIQEEVARADQIITQIMGYAQLSEGRVEKLDARQELDRAVEQVFPSGIPTGIQLHRDYAADFPPLLMQRRHLAECLVNLLQNAREVLGGHGHVFLTASVHRDYAVEITVRDDGPGIAPDKLERIFEAYYTTKDRGTGLGLAIVKHNVELYAGSVRVESVLGRGAKFSLLFPAKTLIKLGQ